MCNLDDAECDLLQLYKSRPVAAWPHECDDCGRTIVKGERYETVVWAEWDYVRDLEDDLALPLNDPHRRRVATRRPGQRTRPFGGGRYGPDNTLVEFRRGTEQTSVSCLHCLTAARWVREVCGGLLYGSACWQLAEHWHEDSVYRCLALARLVLHSGARFDLVNDSWGSSPVGLYTTDGPIATRCRTSPWTDRHGQLLPLDTVDAWVTDALVHYRFHTPDYPIAA